MTRKMIISVTGIVLLAAAAVFAAEKVKEKKEADKPEQKEKTCEIQKQRGTLVDQLIAAYKADDKKAIGEIIAKMEQRRERMRKLEKFSRWHGWEHRRMDRSFNNAQGWNGRGCGMRQGFSPRCQGCCPMGMNRCRRPDFEGRPAPAGQGCGQRRGCMPGAVKNIDVPPDAELQPDEMTESETLPGIDLPDVGVADVFGDDNW